MDLSVSLKNIKYSIFQDFQGDLSFDSGLGYSYFDKTE